MGVTFECENCQKKLRVNDDVLGKKVRCPNCKGVTTVPLPPAAPPIPLATPVTQAPSVPLATPVAAAPPPPEPDELSDLISAPPQPQPEEFSDLAPEPRRRRDAKPDTTVRPNGQSLLRTLVFLAGLGGAAASAAVGALWWSEQTAMQNPALSNLLRLLAAESPSARELLTELNARATAYPLLLVGAGLGLLGTLLAVFRFGVLGGLLLLAGFAAPAAFTPRVLVLTGLLAAAGLMCFLIRTRRSALARAKKRAADGMPPERAGVLGVLGALLVFLLLTGYGLFVGLVLTKVAQSMEEHQREFRRMAPRTTPRPDGGEPVKPVTPPVEPVKPISADAVNDEIAKAGAAAKLVTIDLSPGGLNATIRVPEGSALKSNYGTIVVEKDERFGIVIPYGRGRLAKAKEGLKWRDVVIDAEDLVVSADRFDKKHELVRETVLGHQDVAVFSAAHVGDNKPTAFTRADCLLMAHCARTLALKAPPPADPAAALGPFLDKGGAKEPEGSVTLNNKATDATLALLPKVGGVRHLSVERANLTDACLVHLKGLTDLRTLRLGSNLIGGIKGDGLVHLSGLTKLEKLHLTSGGVSDDSLKHLAGLTDLKELDVRGYFGSLKGPGLAHLVGLKKLESLSLASTQIDDTALSHLGGFTALTSLDLSSTKVTGARLKALTALPNLRRLNLSSVKLRNADLAGVEGLVGLESLNLSDNEVGGDGLAALKKMTRLKSLNLSITKVTDKGVAHLAGLVNLESIDLYGGEITDAGLKHLAGMKKLKSLRLNKTKVTPAGLKLLEDLDDLTDLTLWDTPAADYVRPKKVRPPVAFEALKPADLEALLKRRSARVFRDQKAEGKPIVWLTFEDAKLTDLDLADLRDLKALRVLSLGYDNEITDAGLHYLKFLTGLEELDLGRAKVEGDGLAQLAGLTNLKKLRLPSRRYTAKQLAPLAALVNLEEYQPDLSTETEEKLRDMTALGKLRELFLPRVPLSDAALGHVGKLVGMEHIFFYCGRDWWQINDAGLAALKGLKKLKSIRLVGTAVTGEGLAALAGCADMEFIELSESPVGDAGLRHLAGLTKLTSLNLGKTKVTDAGMVHLKGLTALNYLDVSSTAVTALEPLTGLKALTHLDADDTPFSDAGLKSVAPLTALRILSLERTAVTDAGVEHLAGLTKLEALSLEGAKLTGAGFAKLRGLAGLSLVTLTGSKVNDAGLDALSQLPGLEYLPLAGTAVTDAGLPALNKLAKLRELNLAGTAVTGSGLKDVKALTKVTTINLNKTKVSDDHLRHIANFPALIILGVAETPVGDAGLAHLKSAEKLQSLVANKTAITDAGLEHLAELKELRFLGATGTKVTEAGVQKARKASPMLQIAHGED